LIQYFEKRRFFCILKFFPFFLERKIERNEKNLFHECKNNNGFFVTPWFLYLWNKKADFETGFSFLL